MFNKQNINMINNDTKIGNTFLKSSITKTIQASV